MKKYLYSELSFTFLNEWPLKSLQKVSFSSVRTIKVVISFCNKNVDETFKLSHSDHNCGFCSSSLCKAGSEKLSENAAKLIGWEHNNSYKN